MDKVKGLHSIKDDDVKRLECTEKSMVREMCNATMTDGPTSGEMRRLGVENINGMMRKGRLHWFGCGEIR